jgi:hypothetical protein
MFPAAREILHRGEATDWLKRLAALPESGGYMLYAPQPAREAAGHCTFNREMPPLGQEN